MIRMHGFKCLTIAALALSGMTAWAQTSDSAPGLAKSSVKVVIGDFPGFLDQAGALAAEVVPQFKPDMARKQVGGMLGDPELSAMPAGSGLALVMPDQDKPYGFLEVDAAKAQQYKTTLTRFGAQAVDVVDGVLVVAGTSESLTAAKKLVPEVKTQLLAGKGDAALRVNVQMAKLINKYEPQIEAGLEKLSAGKAKTSDTTGTAAQMEAAAKMLGVYVALGKQVETFNLTLKPSKDGLTADSLFTPLKPFKSTERPNDEVTAAKLMELIPGKGAVRAEATFNPQTMMDMTQWMASQIASTTGTDEAQDDEFAKWMKMAVDSMTGTMAMTYLVSPDAPMSGAYAVGIKDEASALKFLKATPENLENSAFGKFYADLGMKMSMSFQENVREHAGVAISRLKMDITTTENASEAQRKMMEAMGKAEYDVAVVDKVLLYAVAPVKIESLIDAAKRGSNPEAQPLVSKERLPEGARFYADYHVGRLMGMMSTLMQSEMSGPGAQVIRQIAEGVKDAPPILIGAYIEDGKLRVIKIVPAPMLKAFVKSAQAAAGAARKQVDIPAQETTSTETPAAP